MKMKLLWRKKTSKKKEIFKKYELAEGKNNEYEENKKQLFSLGDETFWKYFFDTIVIYTYSCKLREDNK